MKLRVVLVEPMYDGNVGSVARSMKNFGFDQLVLVNPCRIEDFGLGMASHARDILEKAKVVERVEEAISGAGVVVGTTGKRLDEGNKHLRLHIREPWITPAQLADKLNGKCCEVALLLGRENWGLTNEELCLCNLLVSIPTSETYPVMNIAHAATVMLYELSQVEPGSYALASPETLHRLGEYASSLLEEINYPDYKREFKNTMLRRILGRAEMTEREANTLLGMIKLIRWHLASRKTDQKEEAVISNLCEYVNSVPEIANCWQDYQEANNQSYP